MKIRNNIKLILLLLFYVTICTAACDTDYDKKESLLNTKNMLIGVGCLMKTPIVMEMTTYDMADQIIAKSRQTILNMTVSSTQPNMLNMYEMYAGVELQVDLINIILHLDDPMPYVKQNPLLTQFWALKSMESSVDAGSDTAWLTEDDTIDPIYGYFETTRSGGRYMQIQYSDFGVTPKARIDFEVKNNLKVKTWEYAAGSDGNFGTEDDVLTRTTVYQYDDAGKMLRAVNYSGDETGFVSSYVFTYDDATGRLLSMMSYEDEAETSRLLWGSYSILTWDDSGETTKLTIDLGLRMQGLLGPFNQKLIKFYYEFNEDGMIGKLIQYQPISSDIDTCYIYNYSGGGMLATGKMNDSSDNYSDNGITQKSRTVNSLNIDF